MQRAALDENGRHRATTLVQARLNDQAFGRSIDCSGELENFGLQQDVFK